MAQGQLDLDRPGEQHVVELVVLEHGDDAARPRGPLHPPQGVHRIGQAVQALGAPDQVEGFLGDRQVPQVGPGERHAIGQLALGDLPPRQLEERRREVDGQHASVLAQAIGQPVRIDAVAAGQVQHAIARAQRQAVDQRAQLALEGAVIGQERRGIAGQLGGSETRSDTSMLPWT